MSKITIIYDEDGLVTTYEKELPESPTLDSVFQAYLEANERFTFMNDVTVKIHGSMHGDTELTWTHDDGVDIDEDLDESEYGFFDNNGYWNVL